MHTCTHHPNARAAWTCSRCGADLCPACAALDEIQRTEVIRCVHCGSIAQQIKVKKNIVPYWGMFGVFLKAIFSLSGILQVLAVGAVMFLLSLVPIIGGILSLGVYAGYYFLVITRFAFGEEKLPLPPDFRDFWDDILGPFFRFLVATMILWVPAFIYVKSQIGLGVALADPGSAIRDPVFLLILILCILYFPGAMITAAVSQSVIAMMNPLVILGIIVRIPKEYLITVVVWGMLSVADAALMNAVRPFFLEHYVFLISNIIMQAIGLLLPILTAMILGRLVYQNSEELGFARLRDQMVAEFPEAKPQGSLPPGGFEKPAPAKPVEPISLEPESSPAVVTGVPVGVEGGGQPAQIQAQPERADPARTLQEALEAGDSSATVEAYERLSSAGQTPELTPQLELRLANILERTGNSLGAAHACRRAAQKDPTGPMATRAIFTAGRLLTEKLGEQAQGIAMYRYLVDNYPADPLSERAREMLRRLEG